MAPSKPIPPVNPIDVVSPILAVGDATGVTNTNSALKNVVGAATDLPAFLSRLTSPNLWIRVAEAGLGLLLLIFGINAMVKQETGHSPAKAAAKTGEKAGEAAVLA